MLNRLAHIDRRYLFVIVALAVAMFRGLPQSLRELSADLRGRTGAASHRAPTRSRGL